MRILVHGMQSSGATSFSLFLAQKEDSLALIDIANNVAAPRLKVAQDFIAKTVITTAYPLAVHVERFRPDRVVLFLRDPRDNYESLMTKPYRNHSGLIDEKFVLLDQVFANRHNFDAVIEYESFVKRDPSVIETVRGLGWDVDDSCYAYRRRHQELLGALWQECPHLWDEMDLVMGNVRGQEVSQKHLIRPRPPEIEKKLENLCPGLLAYYRERQL